jgi:hypothetical protein
VTAVVVRFYDDSYFVCGLGIRVELHRDISQWVRWESIRDRCPKLRAHTVETISGQIVFEFRGSASRCCGNHA